MQYAKELHLTILVIMIAVTWMVVDPKSCLKI